MLTSRQNNAQIDATEVRPIYHRSNKTDDADQLLKRNGMAKQIFEHARSEWANSQHRYTLEHPDFDIKLENCRFEVNVARRKGEVDRVSVTIRFPEGFPLQSSQYQIDLNKGIIAGSNKRSLGDGHVHTLKFLALAAA